ncbi:MAG TPA: hypothetical protein VK002_06560 [Rubricoccaceae bacterium]|nr:hypothetical protein [Rubricoccaceae bacterium]
MPYRVLLSTSPPLGQIELSGAVSWAEIDAALRALYGDPAWPPGTGVLLDARAVAAVRVTPGEVGPEAPSAAEATMTALAGARAGGRTAVVSRDLLFVSLAVVVGGLGPPTGREVRAFAEVEDALAFLGLAALPEAGVVAP